MNPTHILKPTQWAALAEAEKFIHQDGMGCHAFTDVNANEGHRLLYDMWLNAENQLDAEGCVFFSSEDEAEREVAKRVAHALAILAFGVDYIEWGEK